MGPQPVSRISFYKFLNFFIHDLRNVKNIFIIITSSVYNQSLFNKKFKISFF